MSNDADALLTAGELVVTRASIDVLRVEFGDQLNEGEAVASVEAVLYSTDSTPGREVDGFVVDAIKDEDDALVSWTGDELGVLGKYVLHTRATLNSGARLVALTRVRCVG